MSPSQIAPRCTKEPRTLSRRQVAACIEASKGPNRVPQSKLAARYGVAQQTISMIVKDEADFHPCRTRYDAATKERAVELRQAGMQFPVIAALLGAGERSVKRWMREAKTSTRGTKR